MPEPPAAIPVTPSGVAIVPGPAAAGTKPVATGAARIPEWIAIDILHAADEGEGGQRGGSAAGPAIVRITGIAAKLLQRYPRLASAASAATIAEAMHSSVHILAAMNRHAAARPLVGSYPAVLSRAFASLDRQVAAGKIPTKSRVRRTIRYQLAERLRSLTS
jgi:hypothetical protein